MTDKLPEIPGGPRCGFCVRAKAEVARLFMGVGAESLRGTAFICDRCVATLTRILAGQGVALEPNTYCAACGFEIRVLPSVKTIRGRVCRCCAYELALWCLGIGALPSPELPDVIGIAPRAGWSLRAVVSRIRFLVLYSPARNRYAFWGLVAIGGLLAVATGWWIARIR